MDNTSDNLQVVPVGPAVAIPATERPGIKSAEVTNPLAVYPPARMKDIRSLAAEALATGDIERLLRLFYFHAGIVAPVLKTAYERTVNDAEKQEEEERRQRFEGARKIAADECDVEIRRDTVTFEYGLGGDDFGDGSGDVIILPVVDYAKDKRRTAIPENANADFLNRLEKGV